MRRTVATSAAVLAAALALVACGDDDGDAAAPTTTAAPAADASSTTAGGDATTTTAAAPSASGEIVVFAAASLTDAFEELGAAFEAANPDATVTFNFAGSSALREQIIGGAPADVFASANLSNMQQVVDAGGATDPTVFVANSLEIAVPAGNEAGVDELADFADPALLLGLCAVEVPCGQFGREALENAGVTPSIDTEAPDVRALLTQIESGDLDAGIVYRTDVLAAGDTVAGIEIPADQNVVAEYPIAALAAAPNPDGAAAFVAFVLSDAGLEVLASYGFATGG